MELMEFGIVTVRFWEGLQQVKLSQKLPHLEEDVLSPGNKKKEVQKDV